MISWNLPTFPCVYHILIHSLCPQTYVIIIMCSTPLYIDANKFMVHWYFNTAPLSSNCIFNITSSHNIPYIYHHDVIHNTFRLLRHPCPMPWWHRCSVKESLGSTHWTSTFPPLFFDPFLPPTTSAILILKSPIITIHFPWLALNSIKFPISSTTQSYLASKLFTLCHRYTTTYFPSTNTSIGNPRFLPPLNI